MIEAKDLDDFLKTAGWGDAQITPLPADFSTRRFARLTLETKPRRAILMQATQDQKTKQFVAISGLLRRCGLNAPEVYAVTVIPAEAGIQRPASAGLMTHLSRGHATLDPRFHGDDTAVGYDFALIEDLGDVTFGQLMDQGYDPLPLYRRAVDVLVKLHKTFDSAWISGLDLPVFNAATFTEQAELFLDFYIPHALKREAADEERAAFREAWRAVLTPLEALPKSLMLRDFMPDNLMDVPGREGLAATGLLDFQDGGIGPIAYDLASLCECVRRDVSPSILDDMTAYYHAQNPVMPLDDLRRACRILAAQRHMRVLGIVTRLAQQGRTEKLAYVPRLENYVKALLQDDALRPVRIWFNKRFSA